MDGKEEMMLVVAVDDVGGRWRLLKAMLEGLGYLGCYGLWPEKESWVRAKREG